MGGVWTNASVAECLVPVSVTGKTKIQARDYKPSGRFPVIDQGQEQIAGWTDEENAVIDDPLPLIVFGDHTRAFKFVDAPFARGADGTQILRPKPGIDPLFFFYACRAIDLPARGYNRHYTILKEKVFSFPIDEDEQRGIAGALFKAESALSQQSELLRHLQELKRAAMRELFTRGLRDEPQKETEIGLVPESWAIEPLDDSIQRPDYGYTASAQMEPVGPKFLRITDIQEGVVKWSAVPYCSIDESTFSDKRLENGDIVVARIGATTGKAFLIDQAPDAVFASYMIRVRALENRLLPKFLYYFMQGEVYWQHIDQNKGGRLKGGVNIPVLLSMLIGRPSLDEQTDIISILDTIDRKIDLHRRKRAVLEDLFKTLLHNLMTSEIRVDELDLSALDRVVAESEGAAA